MKLLSYLVPVLILLFSFFDNNNPVPVKEEGLQAYDFLNKVRLHPEKFYDSLRLQAQLPVKKTALRWNDTLAMIAERKAMDMAKRNYFGHVDPDGYGINYYIQQSGYTLNAAWVKNKKDNFFESIAAGASSGKEAVKMLIIDEGNASYGHRNHLLGIGNWNTSLADIGIGFVKCDFGKYPSYTCIIIAKHNW